MSNLPPAQVDNLAALEIGPGVLESRPAPRRALQKACRA